MELKPELIYGAIGMVAMMISGVLYVEERFAKKSYVDRSMDQIITSHFTTLLDVIQIKEASELTPKEMAQIKYLQGKQETIKHWFEGEK